MTLEDVNGGFGCNRCHVLMIVFLFEQFYLLERYFREVDLHFF